MKAVIAIAALLVSTSAFASYSASEGQMTAIQNNEVYHDLVIHGEAAKKLYNDLRVNEVPNYNDNVPGYTKSGKNIVCDSISGVNFYCYIRMDRATGAAL